MDKVSKTGLVTFLDDGRMTATLAEFLLQLQGGLMQGSSTQGALVPRGSVLLSSNYVEPERYIWLLTFFQKFYLNIVTVVIFLIIIFSNIIGFNLFKN